MQKLRLAAIVRGNNSMASYKLRSNGRLMRGNDTFLFSTYSFASRTNITLIMCTTSKPAEKNIKSKYSPGQEYYCRWRTVVTRVVTEHDIKRVFASCLVR